MKHVISETHSSEMWSELRTLPKDRLSEIGLHIVKIKIRIFFLGTLPFSQGGRLGQRMMRRRIWKEKIYE